MSVVARGPGYMPLYSDGSTVYHAQTISGARYEGFGTGTSGGATGTLTTVSNLNDSGAGSLRTALSGGSRYIVFSPGLSGNLGLQSLIAVTGGNITLDGFSNPNITITDGGGAGAERGTISWQGTGCTNVIIRGIRVRNAGGVSTQDGDGMRVYNGASNVVIDHCSFDSSHDGNLDVTQDSHDVTYCWCIISKPLGAQKNALLKYDIFNVSVHHNIYANATIRNPHIEMGDGIQAGTRLQVDMRNNIVWESNAAGTEVYAGAWANIVNNFYQAPSATASRQQNRAITDNRSIGDNGSDLQQLYLAGNRSGTGSYDLNDPASNEGIETAMIVSEHSVAAASRIKLRGAAHAAKKTLAYAGCPPRDAVDQATINAIQAAINYSFSNAADLA